MEKVTKKDRNTCAVISQVFQEEKGCTIGWSWRILARPVEVAQKLFCFSEIHLLALALIPCFCIMLWALPCLKFSSAPFATCFRLSVKEALILNKLQMCPACMI